MSSSWTRFDPIPDLHGPGPQAKHVRMAYNPLDGRIWCAGGDYLTSGGGESYRSHIWSTSPSQMAWRMELAPAVGVPRLERPDFGAWEWSAKHAGFVWINGYQDDGVDVSSIPAADRNKLISRRIVLLRTGPSLAWQDWGYPLAGTEYTYSIDAANKRLIVSGNELLKNNSRIYLTGSAVGNGLSAMRLYWTHNPSASGFTLHDKPDQLSPPLSISGAPSGDARLVVPWYRNGSFAFPWSLRQQVAISGGRVYKAGHWRTNGDLVAFSSAAAVPTGIIPWKAYWVVGATANDFAVSERKGGPVIVLGGRSSPDSFWIGSTLSQAAEYGESTEYGAAVPTLDAIARAVNGCAVHLHFFSDRPPNVCVMFNPPFSISSTTGQNAQTFDGSRYFYMIGNDTSMTPNQYKLWRFDTTTFQISLCCLIPNPQQSGRDLPAIYEQGLVWNEQLEKLEYWRCDDDELGWGGARGLVRVFLITPESWEIRDEGYSVNGVRVRGNTFCRVPGMGTVASGGIGGSPTIYQWIYHGAGTPTYIWESIACAAHSRVVPFHRDPAATSAAPVTTQRYIPIRVYSTPTVDESRGELWFWGGAHGDSSVYHGNDFDRVKIPAALADREYVPEQMNRPSMPPANDPTYGNGTTGNVIVKDQANRIAEPICVHTWQRLRWNPHFGPLLNCAFVRTWGATESQNAVGQCIVAFDRYTRRFRKLANSEPSYTLSTYDFHHDCNLAPGAAMSRGGFGVYELRRDGQLHWVRDLDWRGGEDGSGDVWLHMDNGVYLFVQIGVYKEPAAYTFDLYDHKSGRLAPFNLPPEVRNRIKVAAQGIVLNLNVTFDRARRRIFWGQRHEDGTVVVYQSSFDAPGSLSVLPVASRVPAGACDFSSTGFALFYVNGWLNWITPNRGVYSAGYSWRRMRV